LFEKYGDPWISSVQASSPSLPRPGAVSGTQLVANFRSGWSPPPVQVSFALQPNEICVGVVDADGEQWLEGEASYTHKSVGFAHGLSGLALGAAMNAVGNTRRRNKAARGAAERWRHIDVFRVYVTTARIALQAGRRREWHDLWYRDFRTVEYDQKGIILQTSGNPASRLHMAPPDYWFVMVQKLAFNEICDVPTS
jgi:hypothetical protein